MNKIVKASLLAFMAAVPLMANETFGGIGVTIYQVPQGVHVVQVIPGTPASETKLQSGDIITAVDGVSLEGKDVEFSKAQLRGQVDKPLEITYTSEGETYSAVLRRAQIVLKNLEEGAVKNWYGGKEEFSSQELEAYASATENEKQLVAVLKNGITIDNESKVQANDVNGIYIQKANEFAPKLQSKKVVGKGSAILRGLNRQSIGFELKTPGTAILSIANANGEQIATLRVDNAKAGVNSVNWNGENVPSGRYMVTIEHNSSVSGKFVMLK